MFDVFKKIIVCFNINHIASTDQLKLIFMLLHLQQDTEKKNTEHDSLLVLFCMLTLLNKINQTVQTVHVINTLQIENINADVQNADDNHKQNFPILSVSKCLIVLIHQQILVILHCQSQLFNENIELICQMICDLFELIINECSIIKLIKLILQYFLNCDSDKDFFHDDVLQNSDLILNVQMLTASI